MFQKWYRSKCVNSLSVISLVVSCNLICHSAWTHSSTQDTPKGTSSPSSVQTTQIPASHLPLLLQEIEQKYTQSNTLSANFTQINENKALAKKTKSTGKILVKRPSKVRWETEQPNPNVLISNGTKFWLYTPPFEEGERGQVIEKKTSAVHSRILNALLSGSFSVARDMKIQQKTDSTFLLTPKPGTAGTVSQATIQIDRDQKLITHVILEHRGGNRSEISLSNIELGASLAENLFVFKAPPNTDQISERSE